MKKILATFLILALAISCKKEKKKIFLPTRIVMVENIDFPLPQDFIENGNNKWKFIKDRKIAYIEISKTEMTDLNSALDKLKNQEMESESTKYTLLEARKGDTLNKKYFIETYKFNNNNYIGGYPVYTYETFSVIQINNTILGIHSFSLGFNLNDTMRKSILNIKPNK